MAIEWQKNRLEIERQSQAAKDAQCDRNTSYLETMAVALQAMIDDFDKGLLPRQSGALFNKTVETFGASIQKSVGNQKWNNLFVPLQDVTYTAEHDIDKLNYDYFQSPEGKKKEWEGKAQHGIGQLRAEAAGLRARLTPCEF
jgi:hypothetical protein